MLIVGLNLLPNDDLEKKFKRLNKEEILLKNNKAGASATGRKFSFPENIKINAIAIKINEIAVTINELAIKIAEIAIQIQ